MRFKGGLFQELCGLPVGGKLRGGKENSCVNELGEDIVEVVFKGIFDKKIRLKSSLYRDERFFGIKK